MTAYSLAPQGSYNPNNLFDFLIGKMNLKNDFALSLKLEVAPPVISKVRRMRMPLSASLLIKMHEISGMSIRDMRDVMGDRRKKYRFSKVKRETTNTSSVSSFRTTHSQSV